MFETVFFTDQLLTVKMPNWNLFFTILLASLRLIGWSLGYALDTNTTTFGLFCPGMLRAAVRVMSFYEVRH